MKLDNLEKLAEIAEKKGIQSISFYDNGEVQNVVFSPLGSNFFDMPTGEVEEGEEKPNRYEQALKKLGG